MKRRSLLTVIASICLILIFLVSMALVPSCAKEAAPPAGAPTYNWKTSTNVGPEWPSSIYVLEWIDLINKKSDGRINITPYWADALGDWVWVMEQVMRGEIESASNPLPTDVDPKLNASHMMYLFLGYDGAKKLLGPGGKLFGVYKDLLAADNMYLLGSFPTGAYGITTREKVVRNPDQAKGVKCRTMPVKACELGVGAMGFSAVPIPFSELYTALQTGIVDARAEATPVEPMMFKDVTNVHIMTYDNFELHWTVWNLDLWNSLSKQDQKIIQDAVSERSKWWWDHYLEKVEKPYLDEYAALPGKQVVYLTDDEIKVFAKRVRELAWPKIKELIGADVYDLMVANAEPLD